MLYLALSKADELLVLSVDDDELLLNAKCE
jgi:hypothetical protein